MANIRIDLDGKMTDGQMVTFKAPCDCTEITGLIVYHVENGERVGKVFTMRDAHGNDLAGLGNLFMRGAYVMAILDTNRYHAYLQNANTNGYLEQRITPVDNLESDSADLPLSARQGKLLNEKIFFDTTQIEAVISPGYNTLNMAIPEHENCACQPIYISTSTTQKVTVMSHGTTAARVYSEATSDVTVTFTVKWICVRD